MVQDDSVVYYFRNNEPHHRNGVGFVLKKELHQYFAEIVPISDRVYNV